jgi:hypothetical protein
MMHSAKHFKWIPACAGMTFGGVVPFSQYSSFFKELPQGNTDACSGY